MYPYHQICPGQTLNFVLFYFLFSRKPEPPLVPGVFAVAKPVSIYLGPISIFHQHSSSNMNLRLINTNTNVQFPSTATFYVTIELWPTDKSDSHINNNNIDLLIYRNSKLLLNDNSNLPSHPDSSSNSAT